MCLAAPEASDAPETGPPVLCLLDLPDEVLALAACLGLTDARDVAAFAAASRRCASICRSAPLRLALPARPAATPREEQEAARAALRELCASWPGTAELDLRGSPLADGDVLAAAAALPALQLLQLSCCKKLTPALPARLLGRRGSKLRMVALQRCFQLAAGALGDVLAAAARPGSRLEVAALSHLSLAGWPGQGAARLEPTGLRALALHNCSKLGGRALAALAAACPRLEVLMLGGSALELEDGAAPAMPAAGGGDAAAGAGSASASSSAGADAARFFDAAQAALLEGPGSILGAGFCAYVAGVVAQLAALIARLPRLSVLEVSFGLPGLAPALQRLASSEPLLLAGREAPVQVWDLTDGASVAAALEWRRAVHTRWCLTGGAGGLTPSDAAALLCCAVNCSSAGRQTPLHAAAVEEEASRSTISALVQLGALVDARDKSGATPLFAACEAGQEGAVEALLAHGPNVQLRNSAGESPLYISSLKGWERVVDLLLAHSRQRGIPWQEQRLYDADGWTPLMAAAVGGRTAIVAKLLAAAGQEAAQLVGCTNRYGQSVLHIAARKGSSSLLRSLVDAGGKESLLAADCDGNLPFTIARRSGNASAMHVLQREQQQLARERQRGTQPTKDGPRPNDHRQQHQAQQRWVGRRLQQRKGGAGGSGGH